MTDSTRTILDHLNKAFQERGQFKPSWHAAITKAWPHLYDLIEELIDLRSSPLPKQEEPVAYRWRFMTNGAWSKWIYLPLDELEGFKNIAHKNLESGKTQLETLYASPPAAPALDARMREALELTPESYVYDFIKNGEKTGLLRLEPWERQYQDAGLIQRAQDLGYIRIDSNVACDITVTAHGRTAAKLHAALSSPVQSGKMGGEG